MSCIKFGMLADEHDLADLVRLVAQRGKELEESSKACSISTMLLTVVKLYAKHSIVHFKYLESLAEMVRKGIEAANDDLRKENEEKLMQEVTNNSVCFCIMQCAYACLCVLQGFARQLPMVGSLLNWWSPLPNDNAHLKGRSFDLKTG